MMVIRTASGVILGLSLLLGASAAQAENRALGLELVAPGTSYSPGILSDDTLYISGLQGTDIDTHKLPHDFAQEVRNCLDNVGRVLQAGDMDYSDVVSVQIYLADMAQLPLVNLIYKTYFSEVFPARTIVQVSKLSMGARIEIAAVAQK